ncbi:MAG: hypothetical protein HY751_13855 [Nitrospinae bacterium]|nr:hypothetical protein [Nitrospinota bacterium]
MRITGVLSNVLSQHGSLEEARKYYGFRGVKITDVAPEADRLCFELEIPCDKLTASNHCALHDKPEEKPVICHRYPLAPDDIENCGFYFK